MKTHKHPPQSNHEVPHDSIITRKFVRNDSIMCGILGSIVFERIIGFTSPKDALKLSVLCQYMAEKVKIFKTTSAFALTWPEMHSAFALALLDMWAVCGQHVGSL